MNKHVSVLLNESVEGLNIKPNGIYVDLTMGRAGHSSEIAKRLKTGKLFCFDKDETAFKDCAEFLSKNKGKVFGVKSDFRNFKKELEKLGVKKVDGVLADLGVSSPQFDDAKRGFSYKEEARLDMRMDASQKLTAYDVVNTYSLNDLARIFREYGEDKYAFQIASKIVKIRDEHEISTTTQLVEIIKSCKPQKELMKKGHPAKQIFQALRIEVNDELGALESVLKDVLDVLNVGGRAAFISFHSLEDRLVKNAFNSVSKIEGSRHNVFALPNESDLPPFKLVNSKPILPSEIEMENNPRSKSAKLRIIERIK